MKEIHPARLRQLDVQRLYREKQRRDARNEALAAIACCAIVVGLTLLFLWSI